MEFDIHIDSLGLVEDIFGLYKFIVRSLGCRNHVLLESVQEDTKEALYSFVCVQPDYLLKIRGTEAEITEVSTDRGRRLRDLVLAQDNSPIPVPQRAFEDRVEYSMPAFDLIKKYFPASKTHFPEIFPRHIFYGGLVGYIGYDVTAPWVGFQPRSAFPDVVLAMVTKVLVFNHQTKSLFQIDNTLDDYEPPDELKSLVEEYRRDGDGNGVSFAESEPDLDRFGSNLSEGEFADMVARTKEHIYAGDIIQAVVSRKLRLESTVDPLLVYQALRHLNPSPYMYYLDFDRFKVIGSSPEALVTLDRGTCHTVPIAGTRKRGRTPEEDEEMERELLNDPKEAAEHVMLVDLARNDLAKISVPGTVETTELMTLRKYRDVMHLISKVSSRTNFHGIDVLKNVFPAGTLSGAPKLRAMEIIEEQEPDSRGPYGGVVGYFALNGDCDWAIAIRTLFVDGNTYTAQAGAGIVADSDPRLEWIETRNKLASPLRAVLLAEGMQQ
ncbi:MAG: anthranilate synthase component I family protein [Promethearchaeota archaeon]